MLARRVFTAGLACTVVLIAGCKPPTDSVQWGYRGNSMIQVYNPDNVAKLVGINAIPEPEPSDPYDPTFPMASEIHENVQVLTDLNALELARLMNAMTTWIAPEEGCAYCHNTENLADDSKYTKVVARQMLKMTRDINANWTDHVAQTGVTCWTCHRGEPVPSDIWFEKPEPPRPSAGTTGWKGGQNLAGVSNNGYSSLPFDPLTPFLLEDTEVRVQGTELLPYGNRQSIKQAEWTYALMMYMSNSLGVNCTYCHQTRAMGLWEESTPQRVTAWHGIRMVRDMNQEHLVPLKGLYPEHRLGTDGDAPKAACATCHKGTYKPLYGETMLDDYPSLRGVLPGRLSPDPTEGGTIPIAYAPEDAAPASMEERTRMAEALAAAEEEAVAAAEPEAVTAADASPTAEAAAAEPAIAAAEPAADVVTEGVADVEPAVMAADQTPAVAPVLAALGAGDMFASVFAGAAQSGLADTAEAGAQPRWQGLWRFWSPPAAGEAVASPAEIEAALGADTIFASVFAGAVTPSGDAAAGPKWQGLARWLGPAPRPQAGTAAPAAAISVDDMTVGEIENLLAELSEKLNAMRAELERAQPAQQAPEAQPSLEQPAEQQPAIPEPPVDTAPTATAAAAAEPAATDVQPTETADAAETEADALAAEAAQLRSKLAEKAASLQGAAATAAALGDAESQLLAMQARLEQQTTALQQQLDVVREQRDTAVESMAQELRADHAAAMAAAEDRLRAVQARLDQQRTALNQQLAVVRAQRDEAQVELGNRVAAREHAAAIAAAERQISAIEARLDQNTHALFQQLDVVREQRDQALAVAEVRVPADEHYAALDASERRIAALAARLRQQTHALDQQLEVVRAQRDELEAALAARAEPEAVAVTDVVAAVPLEEHRDVIAAAEQRLNAMAARLKQQTHALGQQLGVVREQRDAAAEEVAARIPPREHAEAIAALERRIRAIQARLHQQSHALEQQLEVVRAQRDDTESGAAERIAQLQAEHAEAMEQLQARIAAGDTRQEQEREALRQQLAVVREQRDAAEAEARAEIERLRERLAEARTVEDEAPAGEPQPDAGAAETATRRALAEIAESLGGELTDDGIVLNLGGDRLRFASGSATLPADELPEIDRAAQLLAEHPELTARVEGHTDSVGSRALNQSLSRQRAESVVAALEARGVDSSRLTAVGFGPDRPIADNATTQGRSQNRRVELYVSAREQVAAGAAAE